MGANRATKEREMAMGTRVHGIKVTSRQREMYEERPHHAGSGVRGWHKGKSSVEMGANRAKQEMEWKYGHTGRRGQQMIIQEP